MKKKAARKKGAKKPAKKSAKAKKQTMGPCTHTVRITNSGVTPKYLEFWAGEGTRWKNAGTKKVTIKFDDWPFEGRKRTIALAKDATSTCFVAKADLPEGRYGYTLSPARGGPNGPAVDYEG